MSFGVPCYLLLAFFWLAYLVSKGSKYKYFFPEPKGIEDWLSGVCLVLGLLLVIIAIIRAFVYLDHLILCWRFFTLHISPLSGDVIQDARTRSIENYLSLGIWQLAKSLLKEADRDVEGIMKKLHETELPKAQKFLEWLESQLDRPAYGFNLIQSTRKLESLGFAYLEGESSQKTMELLKKIVRPIKEYQKLGNEEKVNIALIRKANKCFQELADRISLSFEKKNYLFVLKIPDL